jgi:hypothetical protein
MGIPISQIDDAVLMTQNGLVERGAFVDMQTDLTDHVAVREMWKKKKKKFEGGINWEVSYQMDHNHSAKAVGLFEEDGSSIGDVMAKGEVDQRHLNAHYVYDQREKAFQRGGLAIVKLVEARYVQMMVSFYELLEEILWTKPVDSTDLKTPFGIAYWVVKNATTGFHGGNPAGFAAGRAGIDSATYPRYQNYTGQYANVSRLDLIKKMKTASRKTKFRSVVNHSTPSVGRSHNGIYMNEETLSLMEDLLDTSNMNLGNDLVSSADKTLFKSSHMTYVPFLDDDSTDPIFMLDWKWLMIGVLAGWENNLSKPMPVANKSKVRRVDLDVTLNMVCTDPRRQTVFSR